MTATPRDPPGFLRGLLRRKAVKPAASAPGASDATLRDQADRQYVLGHRDIETDLVDADVAARFLKRVIAQWRALGEAEPYWSNDTRSEFRLDNLTDVELERFYAGGLGGIRVVEAFESRSGIRIPSGTCVELGCGVGKHTHFLARRFAHVYAVDVAAAGLAVCERQMKAFGLDNVTTVLLASPEDLARCGEADLFFSLSVLQHNPPPLQKLLLDAALKQLRPSGFCLFQTPDWIENYTFSSRRFLEQGETMFDLHCLPKTEVLATLDRHGMQLLDFAPDFTLGSFGSYTYFARKRGAG